MTALLQLVFRIAASFAGGYLANDVVDLVKANQDAKKLAPSGSPVPQIPIANVFRRWMDQAFIFKFLMVSGLAVVVAILFMTRVQRKKLFK